MTQMTAADAVAATLHGYGVRFAFGIPGNDVLELVRACEARGVQFVVARSEPSAAFMADAVFQVTGAPGVLIAALGPGLANAISGIAGALMERSALLVLTGDMAANRQGLYNHQVFDHVALAAPVTKLADRFNPERAAQQTAKALDIACAWPAGPVVINCPADSTRAPVRAEAAYRPRSVLPARLGDDAELQARRHLEGARRPVALVGRGALQAGVPGRLRAFLEAWRMPFFATYKAKGLVDERHPLCLGSVGLSPVIDGESMKLLGEADLIVPIGFDPIELRDAWLDAWPPEKSCLTIDWGPQTHRIFPAGTEALGDVPSILAQLAERAGGSAGWTEERLAAYRSAVVNIVRPRTPARGVSPAALFAAIDDRLRDDWILTVDVGAHRILANHAIRCRSPGQMLQSNGLGCMGYAVPAAIGAQLVQPERTVIALAGDGGMLMSAGELAVAAEQGLPLVVVVLNDSALSLIKLKQSKMGLPAQGVDLGAVRCDKLAEAVGGTGVLVDTLEGFAHALDAAISARRLTVIDVAIDPTEYWEQM